MELYAGSGNLTRELAAAGCSPVTAVDSFAPAVASLEKANLPGVHALCADLERDSLEATLIDALGPARLLLLDPPRDGAPNLQRFLSAATALHEIIYISCDLATYARDFKTLLEAGFEPVEIQPIDLFPQTPHVEVLTRLRRRS